MTTNPWLAGRTPAEVWAEMCEVCLELSQRRTWRQKFVVQAPVPLAPRALRARRSAPKRATFIRGNARFT